MIKPERIARLRVSLEGIEQGIWRCVEVPLTATLKVLHDVIQAAVLWQDYHLHIFDVGEERYGVPYLEWDSLRPIRCEKGGRLATMIERGVTSLT